MTEVLIRFAVRSPAIVAAAGPTPCVSSRPLPPRAPSAVPLASPLNPAVFWARVLMSENDHCWPWHGGGRRPSKTLLFHQHGRREVARRVAYRLAVGPLSPSQVVAPSCGNPRCCNPSHLQIAGTVGARVSPQPRGEQSPRAKLTDAQAAEIRKRRLAGELLAPLAREFGIGATQISRIARGEQRT